MEQGADSTLTSPSMSRLINQGQPFAARQALIKLITPTRTKRCLGRRLACSANLPPNHIPRSRRH